MAGHRCTLLGHVIKIRIHLNISNFQIESDGLGQAFQKVIMAGLSPDGCEIASKNDSNRSQGPV